MVSGLPAVHHCLCPPVAAADVAAIRPQPSCVRNREKDTIVLDAGSASDRSHRSFGAPVVQRKASHLLDLLHDDSSTLSPQVMNSSSSIRSTSSSSDQPDSGMRVAQEFADQLTLVDEKKKLIAAFLQLVDDETLAMLSARLESEKKSRKKGKESLKSKKSNLNVRENGSNQTGGSVASSSMEVISEGSQVPAQTSPSAASRKTFAGDFSLSL